MTANGIATDDIDGAMISSTNMAPMQFFYFFGLPREIRDLILGECLGHLYQYCYNKWRGSVHVEIASLPPLDFQLVSRRFNKELLEKFAECLPVKLMDHASRRDSETPPLPGILQKHARRAEIHVLSHCIASDHEDSRDCNMDSCITTASLLRSDVVGALRNLEIVSINIYCLPHTCVEDCKRLALERSSVLWEPLSRASRDCPLVEINVYQYQAIRRGLYDFSAPKKLVLKYNAATREFESVE